MEPFSSEAAPGPRPDQEGLEKTMSAAGLAVMLRADQRQRWLAGERVPVEDYLRRYPALAEDPEALLDLVYGEFVLREEVGDKPQGEEYLRRFPAHAAALGRQLQLHQALAGGMSESPTIPPLTSPPGQRTWAGTGVTVAHPIEVPGYDVLNEVGRGGMGVVYKARHRGLDRIVALKMVLHADHAGEAARARFHTEAQTVARLQHPNIVQVFEVGEHNGCPYLALEFCGGGSLAEQLDGTPWPAEKAAALIATLARAIQAAHDARVVHRDLKPGNVLLSREGTPKVTDFGLARKLDEVGHTQSGQILGTPSYMAPEQAEGKKDVGPAADVYALGALLYELLTGRPPFKAANSLDTVLQVVGDDPVPLRRLQPKVPRDLETVCLKCLQKAIPKRYGSARELAEDLERFLAGEPIRARPVGPLERAVKWVKRRPVPAALAGVSLVAAGLLIGLGFWFSARMGAARGELAAQEARTEAARQRGELQEFFGLVRQARERRARPQPGWTWDNLDDLRKAAALPAAAEGMVELRTEAAAALGAIDVRQARVVCEGVNVHCLAFQPTGRLLALGEAKAAAFAVCAVRLVDPTGKEPPRALVFPPAPVWDPRAGLVQDGVRSLAFSPDGRWLVAGARSGRLHRWDLSRDPPPLVSWSGHDKEPNHLLFSTDGAALFSASLGEGRVKRWDCRPWGEAKTAPKAEHVWQAPGGIDGVALHPTGGWLGCHSAGKLHSLAAGPLQVVRPPEEKGGPRLQFSPDGRTVVWEHDNVVRCEPVFTAGTPRPFLAPDSDRSEEGGIECLTFSPSGDLLLSTAQHTQHVKLWGAASGRLLADWSVGGGTTRAAFAPDGRTLAVVADHRTLLYEIGGLDVQTFLAHQPATVEGMALHPDGRSLACLLKASGRPNTQEIRVWGLGQEAGPHAAARHTAEGPPSHLRQPLSFHPRLPLLAHDAGGAVAFWDTAEGRSPPAVAGVSPTVLRFAPDGRLWAAVDNEVRSWEPGDSKPRARWRDVLSGVLHGLDGIEDVAAGREWVVAGSRNGRVYLLRAAEAALAATAFLNAGEVESVALAAGETLAAAGTRKGELRLLRVPSGEIAAEMPAHRDPITAVAFGGGLLASGSRDRSVRLWRCDEERLDPLLTLRMPGPVRSLAFHPDGVRLFVLLERETALRVWHLDRLRARLDSLGLQERNHESHESHE
jgi:WD40 repeat protein/tRNA A-37 threonylcarbamoyl transferase component Bud32